ncbi:hypothetical protein CFC21_003330 [Triticum aestivum]|uniref:DUF6598 domain-containing protein n=1 Tax=Triticum aestivum TaxID=4565 RepID=A0A3B5Y4B3_WHEAT|nr:hypothetical protein CFC21_003330 [Triticum aestivum]
MPPETSLSVSDVSLERPDLSEAWRSGEVLPTCAKRSWVRTSLSALHFAGVRLGSYNPSPDPTLCGSFYALGLSFRYVGDFLDGQSMLVYGFIAIRDELDCLRNYIFNCPREQAHEITPDSRTLPLISPVRGNSILDGVLLEYSLKGIEATVDIEIPMASPAWGLKAVTAFTSGLSDAIVLYDGSTSSPAQSVFPISSVVTVQLGHELKLKFDITSKDTVHKGCARKAASAQYQRPDVVIDGEPEPKTYSRFLTFISEKCSFDSGKVSIGDEFKAEVTVTWSTMGPY